ncbi:hypothetical protein ACHQM5_010130 [Ranunculus cassubicifolius]
MATNSNSWSGEDGDGGGGGGNNSYHSPTTSADLGETTEEEEDMANCLILLAQGHSLYNPKKFDEDAGRIMDKFSSGAKTGGGGGGLYAAYQCKTCNRCFSSFQALGGHRASHKKPKVLENKKTLMLLEDHDNTASSIPCHLNLQMGNRLQSSSYISNKSKVHECSICGAEFSSGQALGGHMRRHRSSTTTANNTSSMEVVPYEPQQPAAKKPRNGGLCVDLNLPAPEEEQRVDSKFLYSSKQQPPLVFSASSLVDCHY